MMVSPTVWPLSFWSQDCRMKSSSLSTNPVSRVTDAWGSTIMEVSTIPGGVVVIEGLAGAALGSCTPATTGDAGRVGTLSGSVGVPASGGGGIDEILRMAGWGSRDLSLGSVVLLVFRAMSSIASATGAKDFLASTSWNLFTGSSQGFPIDVRFRVIYQILLIENFMSALAREPS